MIFEGFEGACSQPTSIINRFHVELAMKVAPRRAQDVSRRPQDAPKTPQDSQDGPKTRPRRPQDAPRHPQERRIRGSIWDGNAISNGTPSRPRLWSVLGSILGGFGIDFWSFFREKIAEHWGAFAIQDRFENLPSASLQKERRFPFHVKSGFTLYRSFA